MPTGVYERNEEWRRKASQAQKGKHLSEEHRKKIGVAIKGIYRSEETKEKLSKSHKGKQLSEETKKKLSKAQRGSKSSSWKGGVSPITKLIRNSAKYNQWRTDCFIRDKFICQKCGYTGKNLEVHHKKPFYKLLAEVKKYLPIFSLYDGAMLYNPLWDISNGITLCKKCHRRKRR